MWMQAGVVGAWFGLAGLLTALLAMFGDYGGAFGVWSVAMSIAGVLAPGAVKAQRAVKHELSARRMRLAASYSGTTDHLPPSLRDLALETRMVHSAVDQLGDGSQASRAVWEWMRQVDRLEEDDRTALEQLGLSTSGVREVVFRGARAGRPRGGLTDSQQIQLTHHLERFESTLTGMRALPYR